MLLLLAHYNCHGNHTSVFVALTALSIGQTERRAEPKVNLKQTVAVWKR